MTPHPQCWEQVGRTGGCCPSRAWQHSTGDCIGGKLLPSCQTSPAGGLDLRENMEWGC